MLSVLRRRTLCHTPIGPVRWIAGSGSGSGSGAGRSIRYAFPPAAARKQSEAYKYPEWLNVYRLGSAATLWLGLSRVCTFVIFGVGACLYAPGFYFSPEHSNWMLPAFIVGSAVPMVAVVLASGPSVHAIKIQLPARARRTRESLLKLANNVPPHTRLRLECMKVLPWPTKTDVYFADLTRHAPGWREGLSNLQHTPLVNKASPYEATLWHSFVRRLLGRYYVQRDQSKDRSSAPGVWEKMWEQIPEDNALHAGRQRKAISRPSAARTELKPLTPPGPRLKPSTRP
ncbi:hypothetical protein DOTSEDRAFT_68411 [Dothistroma septosporum NZE10]|uniref:Uncharacterized protein n=1 Tax=Dothistroma septosporum (strain NZE10 / CBS 128990) TaxID=675120 RepID=N1Q1R2_DOTSN|nr:hypothetical protein DOTSEDRAFT_68411 [Dothistroma septosporum NZE10]